MRFPALPVLAGHLVLDLALLAPSTSVTEFHGRFCRRSWSAARSRRQVFLAPSLDEDRRHFGSFGIVLALLAWVLVLTTITITTACAVFSPVWTQWRENGRRASKPREPRLKGT